MPVRADRLEALRRLFVTSRSTRHCWCTAFCSSSWQFALGWYGGGNRRRFEAMVGLQSDPLGMLATDAGEPVGWCACGPRERYSSVRSSRTGLLADRPSGDDGLVWFIACVFVRPDRHGGGLILPLLRAAVEAGRVADAAAVEAWPLARGVRRPGEAHVGREGVFARLGFESVARPTPHRVLMRLDY